MEGGWLEEMRKEMEKMGKFKKYLGWSSHLEGVLGYGGERRDEGDPEVSAGAAGWKRNSLEVKVGPGEPGRPRTDPGAGLRRPACGAHVGIVCMDEGKRPLRAECGGPRT